MDLNTLHRIYFIGIGGIGMSAIARFFRQRGCTVNGYDRNRTPLTQALEQEGIAIHYEDSISLLDAAAQLVVYTPAIPSDHQELNWYRDKGYPVVKRSDALQWITEQSLAITVAGTHGKTTVSTMIAFLFRESGLGCNAFLGGLSVNYNSNYWSAANNIAVIEADEYDRSFLKLKPDIAVLTAIDPDHLDIYGTVQALEDAFISYTHNIKPTGTLVLKHGLKRQADLQTPNTFTYSLLNDVADAYAINVIQQDGGYSFDYQSKLGTLAKLRLNVGGMHNVENTVAAISVALLQGVPTDAIHQTLPLFKGVHRRFEYVIRKKNLVFIDDYAHHPEELAALIHSAKRLFPKMRCVVIFQPHLYSRTRDFADGFARSLDLADQVLLLDIYPAREQPIAGVHAQMIADRMENNAHTVLPKSAVLDFVAASPIELLITAGAGDIDQLVTPIQSILEKRS